MVHRTAEAVGALTGSLSPRKRMESAMGEENISTGREAPRQIKGRRAPLSSARLQKATPSRACVTAVVPVAVDVFVVDIVAVFVNPTHTDQVELRCAAAGRWGRGSVAVATVVVCLAVAGQRPRPARPNQGVDVRLNKAEAYGSHGIAPQRHIEGPQRRRCPIVTSRGEPGGGGDGDATVAGIGRS